MSTDACENGGDSDNSNRGNIQLLVEKLEGVVLETRLEREGREETGWRRLRRRFVVLFLALLTNFHVTSTSQLALEN